MCNQVGGGIVRQGIVELLDVAQEEDREALTGHAAPVGRTLEDGISRQRPRVAARPALEDLNSPTYGATVAANQRYGTVGGVLVSERIERARPSRSGSA
jgi:hypothetical protein